MTELDETLAMFMRNARRMRHLTQHGAARAAGVSRRQWAHMEQGGNVSLDFLKKVAASLGLVQIPVSGSLTLTQGTHVDALKLLVIADAVAEHVEGMRDLAMSSLLPSDLELVDAPAVAAFADEHAAVDERTNQRLEDASRRLASEIGDEAAEPRPAKMTRPKPRLKAGRGNS